MSIFDQKKEVTRLKFREALKGASPRIPRSGGQMYSQKQRVDMEKEIFPYSRFKGYISETEVSRRLKELSQERYQAKTGKEKLAIDQKLRFLKDFTGVKPYR